MRARAGTPATARVSRGGGTGLAGFRCAHLPGGAPRAPQPGSAHHPLLARLPPLITPAAAKAGDSRRRARRGGDACEPRDPPRGGPRQDTLGPLPARASGRRSAARPRQGPLAWTSALARGHGPGRDSPHPGGVGARRSAPPRLQLPARWGGGAFGL